MELQPHSSGLEIGEAVKAKKISAGEVAEYYLGRVREKNPQVNAITWIDEEEVRREAHRVQSLVDRGEKLGPFAGVPWPIKDLTFVRGWPMTSGSYACREARSDVDAPLVSALRNSGALLFGRSNSPEFGTLPFTENKLYGPTHNPWNLEHTSGGSSGGAAAAVAAGLSPIATASDGGGSIRIPASCCGVFGLKPSRGRITKGPTIYDVLHGFVTDGAVSRTVADTAAALDLFANPPKSAWAYAPPPAESFLKLSQETVRKLRIGISWNGPLHVEHDAATTEAVERTRKTLESLGHEVFDAEPAWHGWADRVKDSFLAMWASTPAYSPLQDWSEVEPLNQKMRELGRKTDSITYMQALIQLQMYARQVTSAWGEKFDMLLLPMLGMAPVKTGWLWESGETEAVPLLQRCTAFTPNSSWVNVTGQPAMSVPVFRTEENLPIGAQLVGSPQDEISLLQLAQQLQNEWQWHLDTPN